MIRLSIIPALILATGAPAFAQAFVDATATHLPAQDPMAFSMAAVAADLDSDGDLDLAVAREFAANAILLNDGKGCFTDAGADRISPIRGDHEDVVAGDFDGDGDLDLVFVGEDDQVYGYHLNAGAGRFIDVTARLPSRGTSNAVAAADLDGDGDLDLYIGNNGQDFVFINDGTGRFADETGGRLPPSGDITQDVATGDIDGDGSIDIVLGNENGNAVFVNDGSGHFTTAPLPLRDTPEETRGAALVDVDGDRDLDLHFSNVRLFTARAGREDRLLLNDGTGTFTDASDRLPGEDVDTMWSTFADLDGDGDLDRLAGSMSDITGRTADAPLRAHVNDGTGRFAAAADLLPATATGNIFDIVLADFDGDGFADIFTASRGGPDRLLLRREPAKGCG